MRLDKALGIGVLLSLQNQLSPVAQKARKDLADLEGQVDQLDRRMKAFDAFEVMANRGAQMTKFLTVPLVAAGGVAAKAAIDWEDSFADIRKTVDATEEEFRALEIGIEALATKTPIAPTKLNELVGAAGQLGIRGVDNLLGFTEVVTQLGVATNLSAETAATELARFANITNMPIANMDRLGSTIVDLGNNLATTEAEIVALGMRLASSGTLVGMSEHQILGYAGAMSSLGIEAQAGGSAMSKLFGELAKNVAMGGEKLNLFAAVAGMTGAQFQKAFRDDAAWAVQHLLSGLGDFAEAGGNVYGLLEELGIVDIRMRDSVLRLASANDVLVESLQIGANAWEENMALSKEAALRYGTLKSQLGITRNVLFLIAKDFGEVITPTIQSFNLRAIEVGQTIKGWSPVTKQAIVVIGGLVALLGPVTWLVGTLGMNVIRLITFMGKIPAGVGTVVGSLGKLFGSIISGVQAVSLFLSTNPIGLALLTIAGAATLFYFAWKKNWLGIRDVVANVTGSIKGFYDEEGIAGFLRLLHPLGLFRTAWERNWFGIRDVVDSVTGWVTDKIDSFTNWWSQTAVGKLVGGTGELVGGFLDRIVGPQPVLAGAPAGVGADYPVPVPAGWQTPPREPGLGLAIPPVPVVNQQAGDEINVTVQAPGGVATTANADAIGRDIARAIQREKEARPR